MKSKEELNALKAELENVSGKLHELGEGELALAVGGKDDMYYVKKAEEIIADRNNSPEQEKALIQQLISELYTDDDILSNLSRDEIYGLVEMLWSFGGEGR